jgi:predicted nucleic acid-binding Zn ribbon protein
MATLVYKCEKCNKVHEFITSIKEDKECKGDLKQQVTAPTNFFFGKIAP